MAVEQWIGRRSGVRGVQEYGQRGACLLVATGCDSDLAQYSHTPSLRGAGFEDEDEGQALDMGPGINKQHFVEEFDLSAKASTASVAGLRFFFPYARDLATLRNRYWRIW